MSVQSHHPEKKHWNRLFWKNYFSVCMLEWLSCPLSSQLYDSVCSTHCTSSCTTQITGDHNVKTLQAHTDIAQHIAYVPVAGSGLFFQPCATCGSAVVSKRLQSALYAGAEALIQTANAPVSHRSPNGQRQVRIHGFNTAMWSPSENWRSAVEM